MLTEFNSNQLTPLKREKPIVEAKIQIADAAVLEWHVAMFAKVKAKIKDVFIDVNNNTPIQTKWDRMRDNLKEIDPIPDVQNGYTPIMVRPFRESPMHVFSEFRKMM